MTPPESLKAVEILLVEDSPTDVLLDREALELSNLRNHLHGVPDGVEAMAFLHQQGKYADAPRPDLILLDLNLPKMSGLEFLKAIKRAEDLRSIPVVVLTTSTNEADVRRAYDLHANCYVVKPVDFERFIALIKSVVDFWFSVVTLPEKPCHEA